jgi:hypothetical protein
MNITVENASVNPITAGMGFHNRMMWGSANEMEGTMTKAKAITTVYVAK